MPKGRRRAATFIESRLVDGERLLRSFKERPAQTPGYLEDYAFWVQALIDLYEVTFERRFLEQARPGWSGRSLPFGMQVRARVLLHARGA